MAVVGFDDIEEAKASTPALTTVQQPMYDLGWQGAEMLLAQVQGEKVPERVLLPTRLVVRRSCGCFSQATIQAVAGLVLPAQASPGQTQVSFDTALSARRELVLLEMAPAAATPESSHKAAVNSSRAMTALGCLYRRT